MSSNGHSVEWSITNSERNSQFMATLLIRIWMKKTIYVHAVTI